MLSFKAHDLHIKKMIEAILLFKFFQLWIERERAQIFKFFIILGEKNSLKINQFQD